MLHTQLAVYRVAAGSWHLAGGVRHGRRMGRERCTQLCDRLAAGGWRLAAGGWQLAAGGWLGGEGMSGPGAAWAGRVCGYARRPNTLRTLAVQQQDITHQTRVLVCNLDLSTS